MYPRTAQTSARPIDLYTTGHHGFVIAFTELVGDDPNRGIYIPGIPKENIAVRLPLIVEYLNIVGASSADGAHFVRLADLPAYHDVVAKLESRPGPSCVIRRFFADGTRATEDFRSGTSWGRRSIARMSQAQHRKRRKDEIQRAFERLVENRRAAQRAFLARLESGSAVRHVACSSPTH